MNIADVADEIFRDLGCPNNTSISPITFWLVRNVGKLNTLLYTNYSGVSGVIVPELGASEAAIYKDLFKVNYWQRQVDSNAGAAAWDASVIQVTEGNRTIRVTDRNNIANTFLKLKTEAQKDLMQLIAMYKINAATPQEVSDGTEPGFGFGIDGPLEGYGYDASTYRGFYDLE